MSDLVNELERWAQLMLDECGDVTETSRLCYQAADKIDSLQAIVARLPKTADGVPVVESDLVWNPKYKDPYLVRAVNRLTSFAVSDCYSTRAAAEAAEKEA